MIDVERECGDWLDCLVEGGVCEDLDQLGVACLCKDGQCKVSGQIIIIEVMNMVTVL